MIDHYRPDYGALNCPMLCRLRGPLAPDSLHTAVQELSTRHDALRTTFSGWGRRLTQHVHPHSELQVREVDLSQRPDPEAALWESVAEDLATRVDPQVWPTRATLWRLGPRDHVFSLTAHHLVSDAWSCGVLFNDLRRLYAAHTGNGTPPEPPRVQYPEFTLAQQELLDGDGLQRHRAYWQRRLEGAELPAIPRGATAATDTNGMGTGVAAHPLPAHVAEALRTLASSKRSTPFAAMLAVYYELLRRRTGQSDMAVASLFANRPRRELHDTVGFLANMVVLRTQLPTRGSFLDLLRATHATVIGAFTYQEMPYQLLPANTISIGRARADDVVFQMVSDPGHRASAAGVEFELLVPEQIGSRFAFELTLVPQGRGLRAVLFHRRDWVSPQWAEEFVAQYVSLAGALAATPEAPLASVGQ
ncbi:hypothetical protein GCM10022402_13300 [Salinactinospora qingdaonensis]|uniref:Condensation domain-containing protein n=2 Tax=Salinactinospora qingdaonensis TaxID=702744 RepID=A0ABP7F9L4_9ACTN